MNIEQKLKEIIMGAIWDDLSRLTASKFAQALLTSPDIAIVEKGKMEKMQRVVEACKNNPVKSPNERKALADLAGGE